MSLIEMKTAKITEKGQIAIPKDIRKLEGFEQGSKIAILAFKDRIELRPLKKINENSKITQRNNKYNKIISPVSIFYYIFIFYKNLSFLFRLCRYSFFRLNPFFLANLSRARSNLLLYCAAIFGL